MTVRIVLYSHDSVGLGHIRRNLAIAHALTAGIPALTGETVTGLLVAGRPEAADFPVPTGWDRLILPGVERTRSGYATRSLDVDLAAAVALRGSVFRAAVSTFQPDLVVVDRHPFGVENELRGALHALRAENPSCRIVLGLRDVLDTPDATAAEWSAVGGASALRSVLDAVWIYGDPAIHDAAAAGEIPRGLTDLVAHTGYLAAGRVAGRDTAMPDPFILTTVGGGTDGAALAEAAARAVVPDGYQHLVVTGPQMAAEDRRRVRAVARPGTRVVRRVPDALPLIDRAAAVVCMGGYNTLCEVMSTSTPALVVPRVQRRAEQRIRADALARAGAVATKHPSRADAEHLSAWFAAAVGTTVSRHTIGLDGLTALPRIAVDLLVRGADAAKGGPIAV